MRTCERHRKDAHLNALLFSASAASGVVLLARIEGMESAMGFCEHCQGQRFDRAQVLRALRQLRKDLGSTRDRKSADKALALAVKTIAALEIPHLDIEEDGGQTIH